MNLNGTSKLRIAFIGCGAMGTALIKGLLTSKHGSNISIIASDNNEKQLNKIILTLKENNLPLIDITTDNKIAINNANIVILCIKPQIISSVLHDIKFLLNGNELIISIIAGININYLEHYLPEKQRIIRIMPNTPALINYMVAGITPGKYATNNDLNLCKELFSSLGIIHIFNNELLLNAVTGLSGSGPAYVFMFIESLVDGGVQCGLSRDIALDLAIHTVLGSTNMLLKMNKHSSELKDYVTSPSGTTIAGIIELEKNHFRYGIIKAVEAAYKRSKELGELGELELKKLINNNNNNNKENNNQLSKL